MAQFKLLLTLTFQTKGYTSKEAVAQMKPIKTLASLLNLQVKDNGGFVEPYEHSKEPEPRFGQECIVYASSDSIRRINRIAAAFACFCELTGVSFKDSVSPDYDDYDEEED